jgi:hypothetical protein
MYRPYLDAIRASTVAAIPSTATSSIVYMTSYPMSATTLSVIPVTTSEAATVY